MRAFAYAKAWILLWMSIISDTKKWMTVGLVVTKRKTLKMYAEIMMDVWWFEKIYRVEVQNVMETGCSLSFVTWRGSFLYLSFHHLVFLNVSKINCYIPSAIICYIFMIRQISYPALWWLWKIGLYLWNLKAWNNLPVSLVGNNQSCWEGIVVGKMRWYVRMWIQYKT